MIPISSLTQNGMLIGNPLNCESLQQNLKPNGAVASEPCDETCESSNQPELYNRVMQAKFGISFRGVVEAFLSGKDLTGMDVLSCASSVPSRSKGLFHGFLYFKGEKFYLFELITIIYIIYINYIIYNILGSLPFVCILIK